MDNSKVLESLQSYETKKDLFPLDEILCVYETKRKELNWPDATKVSLRTFRFWMSKGLFSTPLHGTFNRALYPASTIEDIGAVRWLQIEYNLTLSQIKDIFHDLPFSYGEGFMGIVNRSEINTFKTLTADCSQKSLAKARKLLVLCSAKEEKRINKENLKKIATIYKQYDRKLFLSYLKKAGNQLFNEAIAGHRAIEDDDLPLTKRIEKLFKMELLYFVNQVRNKDMTYEKGWEGFKRTKPFIYKIAIYVKEKDKLYQLLKIKK